MSLLVRGKYVLTDPLDLDHGLVRDGAVYIEGNSIRETGAYRDLRRKYPEAEVLGGETDIIMPGIIDAHSHGRGISYVQKGIPYDFLENCLYDWVGAVDLPPDLNAKLTAVRHIRNGCTTMNHIESVRLFDEKAKDKAEASLRAYTEMGIRCAYAPGIKDVNALANDDEDFYETLPERLREFVRPMIFFDKRAAQDYYINLFTAMRNSLHGEMTNIILGPTWAHGCTDDFYARIMELSRSYGGLPMHIHTLQTPYQKEYGERKYGKSLLAHLDDLGVVDANLTLGHGVYVNESDIELMAEKQVSLTHHASCNLAMRNGIAPVYELLKAGVNVAMGIDEKQMNDDEDALHELRMIFYLHRMSGYGLADTQAISPRQVLAMGMRNAARTLGLGDRLGTLEAGKPADIIVVDLTNIERAPWVSPDADILHAFMHRANGRDVRHVIINGNIVMREREFTNIDVTELYAEAAEYMNRTYAAEPSDFQKKMREVKRYHLDWNADKVAGSREVFYKLNARK
ncbi:MAG: amidohydrolase family protein [Treponemataceae bacterium]